MEAQQQELHRQDQEAKMVSSDIKVRWAGLVTAAVITLCVCGGGIWLTASDKAVAGLAAIIGPLATLAGVFVYADVQRRRERKEKLRELIEAS